MIFFLIAIHPFPDKSGLVGRRYSGEEKIILSAYAKIF